MNSATSPSWHCVAVDRKSHGARRARDREVPFLSFVRRPNSNYLCLQSVRKFKMNISRFRTAVLLLAMASVFSPVSAQDTQVTRQAAMERYLQAVPMTQMMEDTYAEMAKQVPLERREEFVGAMRQFVRIDEIEKIARRAMLKTFTAEELNALADFYSSPHGASTMKKFGVYMGDVMPSLMQEIQRAVTEVQAQKK